MTQREPATLERDQPGPTDTEEFLRHDAPAIDALPDDLGLRRLDRVLGGVPTGPVSLGLAGHHPRIVPCPVNVTRPIKGAHSMDRPSVMLLWWSAFFWAANAPRQQYITRACQTVMSDRSFWDRLREYGVTGGSFEDSQSLTRYGGAKTSLGEDDIQNTLDEWFQANNVAPNAQTVYVIVLPSNIVAAYDTTNSFYGHHLYYRSGTPAAPYVAYAVVEYDPDVRRMMSAITHEVYEAVTNPDLRTGYYDHDLGGETEIGDMCNQQITQMDGYPVQLVWSAQHCGCV